MNHLLNPTEHVVDLYLGLLQYLQQAGGILEGAIVGN